MSRIVEIASSRMKNFFQFQKDPLQFLVKLVDQGDVVSLRTSTIRPTFVVNAPDFIRSILIQHEDELKKGRSSKVLRRTIGDGLLTTENEQHKQQRKYMQPAFYKERLDAYAKTVIAETKNFIDQLHDGGLIDVHDEMMKLTLSIITKTMFHTSVEEKKAQLAQAVDATIENTARTLFSPIIFPLAIPTKGNRNHRRAIAALEEMIYETLAAAKQDPAFGHDSLLGMLIETKDTEGAPISDEEIRDQMMTMLLAGHETTANALTWLFYELGSHPEVAYHIRSEVKRCGEPLSYASLPQLPYLKQVIDETLRLYPPAWIILRESENTIEILGEQFPKNSSFLISPYAIHRHPNVFKDPLAFRPERFAERNVYEPFQYFPFGGGPRGCIGSKFALMEAILILAELVPHVSFEKLVEIVEPEPLVSLRVKGGLTVRVRKII